MQGVSPTSLESRVEQSLLALDHDVDRLVEPPGHEVLDLVRKHIRESSGILAELGVAGGRFLITDPVDGKLRLLQAPIAAEGQPSEVPAVELPSLHDHGLLVDQLFGADVHRHDRLGGGHGADLRERLRAARDRADSRPAAHRALLESGRLVHYCPAGEVLHWVASWRWLLHRAAHGEPAGAPLPVGSGRSWLEVVGGARQQVPEMLWHQRRKYLERATQDERIRCVLTSLDTLVGQGPPAGWSAQLGQLALADPAARRLLSDYHQEAGFGTLPTDSIDGMASAFSSWLQLQLKPGTTPIEALEELHLASPVPVLPFAIWMLAAREPLEHVVFPVHRSWRTTPQPEVAGHPWVMFAALGLKVSSADPGRRVSLLARLFEGWARHITDVAYYGRVRNLRPELGDVHESIHIRSAVEHFSARSWDHELVGRGEQLEEIRDFYGVRAFGGEDAKALYLVGKPRRVTAGAVNDVASYLQIPAAAGDLLVQDPEDLRLPMCPGLPFLLGLAAFCRAARVKGNVQPSLTTRRSGGWHLATLELRLQFGEKPGRGLEKDFERVFPEWSVNPTRHRSGDSDLARALCDLVHGRVYGLDARQGGVAPELYQGRPYPLVSVTFEDDAVVLSWVTREAVEVGEGVVGWFDHGGGGFAEALAKAVPEAGGWVPCGSALEPAFLRSFGDSRRRWWVVHVEDRTWDSLGTAEARCNLFVRVSSAGLPGGIEVRGKRVLLQVRAPSHTVEWGQLAPALDRVAAFAHPTLDSVRACLGEQRWLFEARIPVTTEAVGETVRTDGRGADGTDVVPRTMPVATLEILAELQRALQPFNRARCRELLRAWYAGPGAALAEGESTPERFALSQAIDGAERVWRGLGEHAAHLRAAEALLSAILAARLSPGRDEPV